MSLLIQTGLRLGNCFCFVCFQELKSLSSWQSVAPTCWKRCLDPSFCCGLLKANEKVNEMTGGDLGARHLDRCQGTMEPAGLCLLGHDPFLRMLSLGTVWKHLRSQHRPELCLHVCGRLITLSHLLPQEIGIPIL